MTGPRRAGTRPAAATTGWCWRSSSGCRSCSRPVALPVMAKLVIKGTSSASRLWLARRMAEMLGRALPGREIHVVADSAYAGEELKHLPDGRHLDDPAAQGRRPARPAARADREAGPAPREGRPAAVPGEDSPPPRSSRRSPSPATARPRPSPPPRHLPVALRLRHPRRSPSSSSATSPHPASTSPSSPRNRTPGSAQVIERYAAQVGHRGRDRGREAALRHRAGPQPHRRGGRAHRPVPARLPGHRHLLVRHRRPRPRRRRRPPRAAPPGTPPRPSRPPPT